MARTVRIEPVERRVLVDGRPVRLRAKSFDVLALLASRPGHLFPKEVLIDRVWNGRSVSPDVLPGTIREIRRTLGDAPRSPEWIETVSGIGYRLVNEPELIPVAVSGAAPVSREQLDAAEAASVAVLRFVTVDSGMETVARALARDIAVGLARTRWIRVAGSSSAECLTPGARPIEAAAALGVRYVLDGDLRQSDAGFVLQLSLIEASRDRILWADRIAGATTDVAALMDDVCSPVVAAVEGEIELAEARRAQLAPVRSMDAWIGFHHGMALLRRQDSTLLERTERVLREAARADPACARVAAARSWHCWQRLFFGLARDREGTLARARDFAQESIALDARDPLGHWALGRSEWLACEMEAAAANLERAVTLNPSFAIGQYSLGISLYMLGREREAAIRCDAALRLSPLDPMAFAFHCLRAQLACFAGDREVALHHARHAADHPNVHAFGVALAAWVNELSGNHEAAGDCLSRVRRRWPDYARSDYAAAMFHRSRWFPDERRRAIDAAFDRLGF